MLLELLKLIIAENNNMWTKLFLNGGFPVGVINQSAISWPESLIWKIFSPKVEQYLET